MQRFTHRRFGHVDAHKKQKLCDEEVDAQVLVDGVAIALEAAEEAEGEDANGKADKWNGDAQSCDNCQQELVNTSHTLEK